MSEPARNQVWHPFHWFPEFLELSQKRFRAQGRVLLASVLVGIVAGLGGVVFAAACQAVSFATLDAIAGYRPQGPTFEPRMPWLTETTQTFRPWLLPLVAAAGGLVTGFIVFKFAPEAEGHGTDAAIAAYHYHGGYIRPRVPIVKLIASAITISTGGSGGREGPIALIGAGFGSMLGKRFGFSPAQCRILVAAGMGAGIAAIFRAPLAGALFAAEIMYRSPEFESEVILPAGLASVPQLSLDSPWQLLPYLALALFLALLAMLYTRTFYGFTGLFKKLPVPNWLKPAVGAFASGLVGLGLFYLFGGQDQTPLSVLSFGYGVLQKGLTDTSTLTVQLLLAVALGKILTTSLTIGSGGSGGVFGPAMVIGGCGGGAVGLLFAYLTPGLVPHPQSFIILGMAGFFAAAAKTPFSTIIIVSEMTGDYKMILPALWVCVIAYLLSDEQSLYRSQVSKRSASPAHQGSFVLDVLGGLLVGQFFKPGEVIDTLRPGDRVGTVVERLARSRYPVLPVTDDDGRLLGVVTIDEAHLASRTEHARQLLVGADIMRSQVTPLKPEHRLDEALELFVEHDLLALPVVADDVSRRVIGIVRRYDISQSYLLRVHGKEHVEPLRGEHGEEGKPSAT